MSQESGHDPALCLYILASQCRPLKGNLSDTVHRQQHCARQPYETDSQIAEREDPAAICTSLQASPVLIHTATPPLCSVRSPRTASKYPGNVSCCCWSFYAMNFVYVAIAMFGLWLCRECRNSPNFDRRPPAVETRTCRVMRSPTAGTGT